MSLSAPKIIMCNIRHEQTELSNASPAPLGKQNNNNTLLLNFLSLKKKTTTSALYSIFAMHDVMVLISTSINFVLTRCFVQKETPDKTE